MREHTFQTTIKQVIVQHDSKTGMIKLCNQLLATPPSLSMYNESDEVSL